MSSLFPLKPTTSSLQARDRDPQLVDFTETDADRIFSSVSSTTARNVLELIYEEPHTASDLAKELETSVQNVSYHLERLSAANLIEVAETWYSGQGREMDVYAPVHGPLVLYVGAERSSPSLSRALRRVFGAVSLIALASAFVHRRWTLADAAQPITLGATEPAEPTLWESVLAFAFGPGGTVLGLGLVAVCCWFAYWYWRRYRPYRRRGTRPDAV